MDLSSPTLRILATAVVLVLVAVIILTVAAVIKFSNMQRELEAVRRAYFRKAAAANTKSNSDDYPRQISQLSVELDDLRGRLDLLDRAGSSATFWPAEGSFIQLNRRGQILRLAGKGKSAVEIARDLKVSKGEVELLLKVQDLNQSMAEIENSQPAL